MGIQGRSVASAADEGGTSVGHDDRVLNDGGTYKSKQNEWNMTCDEVGCLFPATFSRREDNWKRPNAVEGCINIALYASRARRTQAR
jgi:hypothetical protein